MRYWSIGAIFGYGVGASCAITSYAVPSTTSSAKLLIAIAPTLLFRIVSLPRMGLLLPGRLQPAHSLERRIVHLWFVHPIVVGHQENRHLRRTIFWKEWGQPDVHQSQLVRKTGELPSVPGFIH